MKVYVGLGANLGDARATLAAALREMAALPHTCVAAVSSIYRSAPVEAQGPDFFNAVAEIETALTPTCLLQGLQAIELAHGRLRPFLNAPRTLDLDLLLCGALTIDQPGLTVPHPRLHLRAFVLTPLLELAPCLVHPRLGPLTTWHERVSEQAIERLPST